MALDTECDVSWFDALHAQLGIGDRLIVKAESISFELTSKSRDVMW